METRSQGRRKSNTRQNTNKRQTTINSRQIPYVLGSAVSKPAVKRVLEVKPVKKLSHATRKNRDKAIYMNAGYVMFLVAALAVAGFVLISYIRLQSDIGTEMRTITLLESQLNQIKSDNDEEYSRINSEINLEEIKRIAITELGMIYPEEGQIKEFASENNDYIIQHQKLPD